MRDRMDQKIDKKVFKRTTQHTKSINLFKKTYRGGIRF